MTVVYSIKDFSFQYPNSNLPIYINGLFTVNQGDIILLQGNSGTGKSTLLMALKGIIPHLVHGKFSGQILFNNQDITKTIKSLPVGYLCQNPHSQPVCTTVYQELAFGLENQCISPSTIHQKIAHYSQEFKISHLLHREVNNLSGGEKQKVNLLAILIMEPEVLLLDEPTAFLDPQNAAEVISIIKTYAIKKTVIIIEHNTHYLHKLVNRVIQINKDGQISEANPENTHFFPQVVEQDSVSFKPEATMFPILNIKALKFGYKDQPTLLNNLHLVLYPGQIIGITGRNGSGKSSLLKLISKVLPSKHSILYNMRDIANIKTKHYWKHIVLLWQNPENHFLHPSVSKEISQESMENFGLTQYARENPFCLSEGQKRRLSLALALKPETELFLLDEPTFGQDIDNKNQIAGLISKLTMNNKSFIIISHDMPFLLALTKNIYRLEQGKLITEDNARYEQ